MAGTRGTVDSQVWVRFYRPHLLTGVFKEMQLSLGPAVWKKQLSPHGWQLQSSFIVWHRSNPGWEGSTHTSVFLVELWVLPLDCRCLPASPSWFPRNCCSGNLGSHGTLLLLSTALLVISGFHINAGWCFWQLGYRARLRGNAYSFTHGFSCLFIYLSFPLPTYQNIHTWPIFMKICLPVLSSGWSCNEE